MKTAKEIRDAFLDFFRGKNHTVVASAPVVPIDDPTLLFTNAGMNQFKDVFLGTGSRPYTRVADTQKCIRMSGKHNDLEEVGHDTYHHTFFEMLGNWSFGDYFKEEAIAWAWEFLVGRIGLDPGRLWVTVFEGNPDLGVAPDDEAASLWRKNTPIPEERILRFGMKDNFWEMAATGPCGPCSEIHYDLGEAGCTCGGKRCGVNAECGRYFELWNLVFIQFNRLDESTLKPLPAKHVDTGLGFERLVAASNGLTSNYDIDIFTTLFSSLKEITGKTYGDDAGIDVALRVVADHVRTLCMAITDGAMPDRKKRGSALRSLLRRAARFGRTALQMDRPFLFELVPAVAKIYGGVFPEIGQREDHIGLVIKNEEESFSETIDRGLSRFTALADASAMAGAETLDGVKAYDLLQQDGFPRDLIDQMARERGLAVDEKGWKKAREKHRAASERKGGEAFQFDLAEVEGLPPTSFLGYWERGEAGESGMEAPAKILRLVGNRALVLDRTPFYAEAGGQVGDTGVVTGKGFRFRVDDTGKMGDLFIHYGELEKGDPSRLPGEVTASVDRERRLRIAANHTATHLLHHALKKVLGLGANQQGSVVAPDRLRFDFNHGRAVTAEELAQVEAEVNRKILENEPLRITVEDLEEARKGGVTALFGEKYADRARVIRIGEYSKELCGGTHVKATGQIGPFLIRSEEGVAAGVRRIEAFTSLGAHAFMRELKKLVEGAGAALKVPVAQVPARLAKLVERERELTREVENLKRKLACGAGQATEAVGEVGGVKVATLECPVADMDTVAEQVDRLRDRLGSGIVLGAGIEEGKVLLVIGVTQDLTGRFKAGALMKGVAAEVGGSGGGRPDFARGQGKKPEKLEQAFQKLRDLVAGL
jgi:alanyl-tRNA synthetase